ncbi:unnamed protein product, partial [Meganyctiphanes norvegica]
GLPKSNMKWYILITFLLVVVVVTTDKTEGKDTRRQRFVTSFETSKKTCLPKGGCKKKGGSCIAKENAIACQGKVLTRGCKGSDCVCCIPNKVRFQLDTSVIWPESVDESIWNNIELIERGAPNSRDYHIYFRHNGVPISGWHDIPLFAVTTNMTFNMVVEIPRWTNDKMEIMRDVPLNPIMQDTKDGKLRYVSQVFPYTGYPCNYGALPQTWEDPAHIDSSTGVGGDNDPIDVCEIGSLVATKGQILQVKVLGVLGLVDGSETDWKLFTINIADPMAAHLNDIADVERYMPGLLAGAQNWFRIYKVPTGSPENKFAFGGRYKDREFAHQVIMNTYDSWQKLITGSSDRGSISISLVTLGQAAVKLTTSEAQALVASSPEPAPALPRDPQVDVWHFVPENKKRGFSTSGVRPALLYGH